MAEFISLYSGSSGNCSVGALQGCLSAGGYGQRGAGDHRGPAGSWGWTPPAAGASWSPMNTATTSRAWRPSSSGILCRCMGPRPTLQALEASGTVPAACPLRVMDEKAGEETDVAGFGVRAFATSHDVPCVGYRICTPDGKVMTIATDPGHPDPAGAPGPGRVRPGGAGEQLRSLYAAQRARIRIICGPASRAPGATSPTTSAARSCWSWCRGGCEKFALCHLSQENNTPALALQTVFTTLGAGSVVPGQRLCGAGPAPQRDQPRAGILSETVTKAAYML